MARATSSTRMTSLCRRPATSTLQPFVRQLTSPTISMRRTIPTRWTPRSTRASTKQASSARPIPLHSRSTSKTASHSTAPPRPRRRRTVRALRQARTAHSSRRRVCSRASSPTAKAKATVTRRATHRALPSPSCPPLRPPLHSRSPPNSNSRRHPRTLLRATQLLRTRCPTAHGTLPLGLRFSPSPPEGPSTRRNRRSSSTTGSTM